MQLLPGIFAPGPWPVTYIPRIRAAAISDLHLGFEGFKAEVEGAYIPKVQLKLLMEMLNTALSGLDIKRLIITGDIRPGFGELSVHERLEIGKFLRWASSRWQVCVIRGNHDNYVCGIAEQHAEFCLEKKIGDFLFVHGDRPLQAKARHILLGHVHPVLALGREKIKAWLAGKLGRSYVLVLPAASMYTEGAVPAEIGFELIKAIGLVEGRGLLEFPKGLLKNLKIFF